jgi:DNA-binding response OmpR family regulator
MCGSQHVDRIACVVLETPERRLSVGGRPLDLTTVEFEILARLVQAAGSVVDRERLVAEVFEREFNPEDRSLDVHISRLRKKLGEHASLIVTIRGVGHLLRAPTPVMRAS